MYALQADDGTWATGRYGRFTYGTFELGKTAARILGKKHGRRYRVVEA